MSAASRHEDASTEQKSRSSSRGKLSTVITPETRRLQHRASLQKHVEADQGLQDLPLIFIERTTGN